MIELARRGWARRPPLSPNVLFLGILVTGLIGIASLISVAQVNAQQVEDRASTRATQDSLCRLISLYLPKPGDAPPTTQRGRDVVDRFRAEYVRLECTATAAAPTPRPS